jgi:hypothetical protein
LEPLVATAVALTLVLSAFAGHAWRSALRRQTTDQLGVPTSADGVVHHGPEGARELRAEADGSTLTVRAREVGDHAPTIGDALFDAAVAVEGEALERCAALDAATRDLLVTFVKRGGTVLHGVVTLRPAWTGAEATEEPDVNLLVRVRASLSAAVEEPLARIERIIRCDRRAGVQLAALEAYLGALGPAPRAMRFARELLHRGRGAVRLCAAKHINEAPSWRFIAVDHQETPFVREAALRALVEAGDEAACDDAIVAGLAGPYGLTLATLEVLAGPIGDAWALTLTQMAHEAWIDQDLCGGRFRNDANLGVALMRAFTRHATVADEPELLEIAYWEDNDLADLAWRALARIGTPVALNVIEQRELPRRDGLLARAHRRRAADHVLEVLRDRWAAVRGSLRTPQGPQLEAVC